MAKLDFTTKPLSLSQRIECNRVKLEVTPGGGVITDQAFDTQIKFIRYGLKSVKGVEVSDDNFDEVANGLTNEEIKTIADQVADETNFSKKKKS